MITYLKTDCDSKAFNDLIKELDDELNARYGEAQRAYDAFNNVEGIDHAIMAVDVEGDQHKAVACGCLKKYEGKTAELKRIFVKKECRGKGVAKGIVTSVENLAKSLGYNKMILQTGAKQPEAIGLYEKLGYKHCPCYGHYIGDDNSVCFEKDL